MKQFLPWGWLIVGWVGMIRLTNVARMFAVAQMIRADKIANEQEFFAAEFIGCDDESETEG